MVPVSTAIDPEFDDMFAMLDEADMAELAGMFATCIVHK